VGGVMFQYQNAPFAVDLERKAYFEVAVSVIKRTCKTFAEFDGELRSRSVRACFENGKRLIISKLLMLYNIRYVP